MHARRLPWTHPAGAMAGAASRLLQGLLPARCLLCHGPGQPGLDLCQACLRELPVNACCCARCALPLALPAARCGDCQRHRRPWHSAWVPFRYAWPLNLLETRFKFSANLACGRVLAQQWARARPPDDLPDTIVPVPLHPRRWHARGYNQALELAQPLAQALALPVQADALQRTRHTAPQSDLDAVRRRRNVRGAFTVMAGAELPGHVALLDDVMTTGATLAEASRCLHRAGVQRVDVWALARVV